MRRREFIKVIVGGAAAWPLLANAQRSAMPVIGYIGTGSENSDAFRLPSFHKGLSEAGYVEGRNATIEYRWAEGHNDRLPALAADLVHRQVSVIAVPASTPGAIAAKAATSTIPVVFYIGLDPVALGLVASLNRPGGNLTGVTGWNVIVGPKWLQLLHELAPRASAMALLVNRGSPDLAEADAKEQSAAASTLGVQLHILHAGAEQELATVFAKLIELQVGGLVIGTDSLIQHLERTARRVKHQSSRSYNSPVPRIRLGRWPNELWNRYFGPLSSSWYLHWPNSEGRKAGGHASSAGDKS